MAHFEANETSLLTVPSDLRRRFILSPRPPTGTFTVCVFCNDRHEIAGWCEHILVVINLQQQAVGTPCQQKWHFPDKGLTPNCLQKWHMYHIMVIHLSRTETLLLIYHPLKWFKTDGAPAVRTLKTATCAPANPEQSWNWAHLLSMWPALTWSWSPRGYACWPPRPRAPSARDGGPLPALWDWCLGEEKKYKQEEEMNTHTSRAEAVCPTLCPDRLWHRAGVTEPLSVHGPDDEQVDRVGS